jgi:hypothetical protein
MELSLLIKYWGITPEKTASGGATVFSGELSPEKQPEINFFYNKPPIISYACFKSKTKILNCLDRNKEKIQTQWKNFPFFLVSVSRLVSVCVCVWR